MSRLLRKVQLVLSIALCSVLIPAHARDVRDENGGNCVDVKSCRPRCIAFRLERSVTDCSTSEGIFSDESEINPWAINQFQALNCEPADTCLNDQCGEDLIGDLTVGIREEGYSGSSYYTSTELYEGEESFTFCSIYPCPKDECAVPEQMVSML